MWARLGWCALELFFFASLLVHHYCHFISVFTSRLSCSLAFVDPVPACCVCLFCQCQTEPDFVLDTLLCGDSFLKSSVFCLKLGCFDEKERECLWHLKPFKDRIFPQDSDKNGTAYIYWSFCDCGQVMYNDTMSAAMKFGPRQLDGHFRDGDLQSQTPYCTFLGHGLSQFLTYSATSLIWIRDLILNLDINLTYECRNLWGGLAVSWAILFDICPPSSLEMSRV